MKFLIPFLFLPIVTFSQVTGLIQGQNGKQLKPLYGAKVKLLSSNEGVITDEDGQFELILPRAYYVACRDADRSSRQFSIEASIDYLSSSLAVSSDSLTAVVGGCYNRHLEEFRISFSTKNSEKVIHGVIWPLLGPEDEFSDIIEEVVDCLKKFGITHFETLDQRLPMEYCEDCGSPLYPNIEGEMTHAEFPESENESPHNLH